MSHLPVENSLQGHVCHITVLNPLRHTRIYYKLAWSQREAGWRVTVAGQGSSTTEDASGIELLPIAPFGRLSLKRLFFPWLMLWPLLRLRADVYVLHSPELLGLGWLLRRLTGAAIVYDVHEDYAATLRTAGHYPAFLRELLARWVRGRELRAVRWLSAVSYAEECYDNVLEVPDHKRFILRNAFSERAADGGEGTLPALPEGPYMLYTGTMAAEWGLFHALRLWRAMSEQMPLRLVVAGYTPRAEVLAQLNREVAESPHPEWFTLVGGANYVPYAHILRLIRNCWFGVALYEPLPYLREKIPTRFFEYAACGKALVYHSAPAWDAWQQRQGTGIVWEEGADVGALLEALRAFRVTKAADACFWTHEEPALMRLMAGAMAEARAKKN